jgi:hypothetical protein
MNTLLLSVVIGLVAGLIDIVPMWLQRLKKDAVISAFLQYLFVSVIIVNIDLPYIAWWLEGGMIAFALALPVVMIVAKTDKKSVPIILITSVILGTLIGIAGHFLK